MVTIKIKKMVILQQVNLMEFSPPDSPQNVTESAQLKSSQSAENSQLRRSQRGQIPKKRFPCDEGTNCTFAMFAGDLKRTNRHGK